MQNIIESLNIQIGGEVIGYLYDRLEAEIESYGYCPTCGGEEAVPNYEIEFYAPQPSKNKGGKHFGSIHPDRYDSPFKLACRLLGMKGMAFPDFDAFAKYLQDKED